MSRSNKVVRRLRNKRVGMAVLAGCCMLILGLYFWLKGNLYLPSPDPLYGVVVDEKIAYEDHAIAVLAAVLGLITCFLPVLVPFWGRKRRPKGIQPPA